MKLANRIGAAVLATAMVGTLLTGCGGGSASTTASTGDGTAAASSTESSGDGDNTYTMFMRSTYVDWIKELMSIIRSMPPTTALWARVMQSCCWHGQFNCLCPENRRCGTLIYSRAKMTVRQWLAQARAATKKSTVQI